jgi:hypothetical protein
MQRMFGTAPRPAGSQRRVLAALCLQARPAAPHSPGTARPRAATTTTTRTRSAACPRSAAPRRRPPPRPCARPSPAAPPSPAAARSGPTCLPPWRPWARACTPRFSTGRPVSGGGGSCSRRCCGCCLADPHSMAGVPNRQRAREMSLLRGAWLHWARAPAHQPQLDGWAGVLRGSGMRVQSQPLPTHVPCSAAAARRPPAASGRPAVQRARATPPFGSRTSWLVSGACLRPHTVH